MTNKLIEFTGYDMKPLFIVASKILAVSSTNEKHGSPSTKLLISLGETSEEWVVRETLEAVTTRLAGALT
jgi:hypothetical protein